MYRFFVPMKKIPRTTHQQKQVHVVHGKPIFYEPNDLKLARQKLLDIFQMKKSLAKLD